MPTPPRSPLDRPLLHYPVMAYDEILRNAAARWPDKEAIVWRAGTLTFRELDSLANALAKGLRGPGVRQGGRGGRGPGGPRDHAGSPARPAQAHATAAVPLHLGRGPRHPPVFERDHGP